MTPDAYPADSMLCSCGGTMRRVTAVHHPGRSITAEYHCKACTAKTNVVRPLYDRELLPALPTVPDMDPELRATLEAVERFAADVATHLELTACLWPEADEGGIELRRRAFLIVTQTAQLLERRDA